MNRWVLVLAWCLLLWGCSSPSTTADLGKPADAGADQAAKKDAVEIKSKTDVVEAHAAPETLAEVLDGGTPDGPQLQCEPGEGCFLDSCVDGSDCLSGLCVDHMGEPVCTVACVEECPSGWECRQLLSGPDLLFACISPFTHLCRPCQTAEDCESALGVEDPCVVLGPQGSFCGAACQEDKDCPAGFACADSATAGGGETRSCVPASGECECSPKATELGLATTCFAENEFGVCEGLRSCGQSGLSECDAQIPAQDECNGVDDDCDGIVDEILCDDEDVCTADSCQGADGCLHEPLYDIACDDEDACTAGDQCDAGNCIGTVIDCDDDNLCTDDSCTPVEGCLHEYNWNPCNDEDPCTAGDTCKKGVCQGKPVACDCTTDEDCAALEDDDLCNGTLRCDLDGFPYKCVVDPDTVPLCPAPEGPDNECLDAVCDPATAECGVAAGADGKACSDGDSCTFGEMCVAGSCGNGLPVNCNDGNLCTDDACEPATGCVNTFNTVSCDDENWCTVGDLCSEGACAAGSEVLDCADTDLCTEDGCDPEAGCTHLAKLCDDDDLCTLDTCHAQSGECVSTPVAIACEACTSSVCDPATGDLSCQLLDCDDNNACTADDCPALIGTCRHLPVVCNDGNPCTDDSCDNLAGCQYTTNSAPCNDGNACTTGDECAQEVCVGGKEVNCNDGNLCTDDSCAPQTGCINAPNQLFCSDDDVCTLGDVCQAGNCNPGAAQLDCNDGNPCTDDVCQPTQGCEHIANQDTCDDGNECTSEDSCVGGQCKGGEMVDCDDSNPCTKDGCLANTGCHNSPVEAPCSDGNACTLDDHCLQGQCASVTPLDCDDENPCTQDSCDSQTGCLQVPAEGPCDDDDLCTTTDSCVAGKCVGSEPDDCDDLNVCTDDDCDPQQGCQHTNNQGPCDDDDLCTTTDSCQGGDCIGSDLDDCDDLNDCTDDDCDPQQGCQHTNNQGPCDDDDACTTTDSCQDGKCVGSDPKDCDDGSECTEDSCTPDGCVHTYVGDCAVQPGPAEGMDHVIGSVYNIDPNGTMDHIRTGGWGDNYWALLQFPLDGLPLVAGTATIRLFGMNDNNKPTSMHFDRVTSPWAENCSWSQKPSYVNLKSIPPSQVGVWYEIDVTGLYNGWRAGDYPNYGVQFRSHGTSNNYNGFWSSDYTADPTLRPMLVVEAPN